MEKEYIVVLNADVDFAQFNQEMIDNTGAGVIPNRTVNVANARPYSQLSTHYSLTDEEAEELRNDSRVRGIELPLTDRDDVKIGFNATQSGNFAKTTSSSGNNINWGLRRCMQNTNPYGTTATASGDFTYTLDGTGVDVVIIDTGIQVDHPEFNDADGNSRVQQIDWYTESGISGTQSANHYSDYDGHGTHVTGTVAGLTFGWAKNARIYSIKHESLTVAADVGTGFVDTEIFDIVKQWHINKPIDPATRYPYNKALETGDIWLKESSIIHYIIDYGLSLTQFHNFGTPSPGNPYGGISFSDATSYKFDTVFASNPLQSLTSQLPMDTTDYEGKYGTVVNTEIDGSVKIYYYKVVSGSWIRMTPTMYTDYTDAKADANITNNEYVVIIDNYGINNKNFQEYDGSSWQTYSAGDISFVDTGSNSLVIQRGGTNLPVTITIPYDEGFIAYPAPTPTSKLGFSEGHKRPTIVNMSFGTQAPYGDSMIDFAAVYYRGNSYGHGLDIYGDVYAHPAGYGTFYADPQWAAAIQSDIGTDDDVATRTYLSETYGIYPYEYFLTADTEGNWLTSTYASPYRLVNEDYDVEEMIAAGIHVCIAAGNNSFKADASTGLDYNNKAFIGGSNSYYHRGSSPYSEDAFMVGSTDSNTHSGTLEQISSFSTKGPGVTMWAPGDYIKSASTDGSDYYLNSSYKQETLSGTSMASPQVCGLGATILQTNPHLTPTQLKEKMTNMATDDLLYSTSSDTDYNDTRSLLGSNNKFLNTPFNSQYPLTT